MLVDFVSTGLSLITILHEKFHYYMNLEAELEYFPLCDLEEKKLILHQRGSLYWCDIMNMADYLTLTVNID